MADEIDLTIKLIDDATGPARNVKKSLNGIQTAANSLNRAGGRSFGGIADHISAIGKAALIAGAAVAALGAAAFAKTAVQAAVFGDKARFAFKTLMKGTGNAEVQFERVQDLAIKLGLPIDDTIKSFQKLLAMQFTPQGAEDILKMSGDLQAVGASADEVSRAVLAITQIKATGKLQGDELMQLAEAGVSVDLVYQALAKQMGKTTQEVMKLKEAGKIGADDAIKAIQTAVLQKVGKGKLGEAGEQAATQTMSGMAGVFKARMGKLFMDLGKDILPTIKVLFERFTEFADAIMPDLSALFSDIGKVMKDVFGSDGAKDAFKFVIDDVRLLINVIRKALPIVGALVSGFLEGFTAMQGPLREMFKGINEAFGGDSQSAMKTFIVIARILGIVIGGIAGAFAFLFVQGVRFGVMIAQIVTKIIAFVAQVSSLGGNAGNGLIDGLAGGIDSGVARVVAAVNRVASAASNAMSSALKIGSPSKVFEGFGQMSAEGYAMGLGKGSSGLQTASSQLAASGVPQAVANSSTTNTSSSFAPVTSISVEGRGKTDQEFAAMIERVVKRVMSQQLSGSPG